jgi:hypothetical protein
LPAFGLEARPSQTNFRLLHIVQYSIPLSD